MKKRLNIFIYTILASLIFQNVFFWVTFADEQEECDVCSRMSNEMQMYVNFQVEMIGALRQVSTDREIYSGLTKRGLFSYGGLSLWSMFLNSLKSSLNKTTQAAVDSVRAAEWASVIVAKNAWTIGFSAEWAGDMLILFRQKPFMRDRNTLQEIDGNIDDLIWDIWMQGLLYKSVSSEIMSDLVEISERYTEVYPIFSQFQINGNITYVKLVFMLDKINRIMKNFFTEESMFTYQKNAQRFEKDMAKWNSVTISFNHEYLVKLSDSYACVKGKAWFKNCGGSLQNFASDVSHIWTDVKTQFEKAWKEIKESSKKLAEVSKSVWKVVKNKYTNGWDLWLTDDQVELLRDVYGINTAKLTKQQWLSLSSLFNGSAGANIKNSITISSDAWNSEIKSQKQETNKASKAEATDDSIKDQEFEKFSDYQKNKYCIRKLNTVKNPNEESKWYKKCMNVLSTENKLYLKNGDDSYIETYVSKGRVNYYTGMITYLNESVDDTLSELDLDKAVVMYSQSLDTTRYFVEIWAYIHNIVDNVIWTKNWSSNTIVNNLGKACETQCSNKWWMCYK